MNDAELLRRYAKEGSQEAFAELVRMRIGLVYAAALRQTGGDIHRAQDVAQTVFSELARNAVPLCRHPALIGWLYTSTRYTAAKLVRSDRRRQAREQEAYMMHEEPMDSPAPEIHPARLRPLIDEAMHQLSESDRRALLLRFFGGYSMAELGSDLGLSEATAQKKVERALAKLKNVLGKRGLSSTAVAIGAALSQEAAAVTVPTGLAAAVSGSALVAAATAAPVLGFVSFMSATKLTLGAVGLVGAATILGISGIGFAAYEHREAGHQQAALKSAELEYRTGQGKLRILQSGVATAEKNLADIRNAGAQPRGASPPIPAQEDMRQKAMNSPEWRAIEASTRKTTLAAMYAPFYKSASISPATIERLQEATAQAGVQADQLPDAQLRDILGDQAYQQFKDFNQVLPAYMLANSASADASIAGVALSSDQMDQLSRILAANLPAHQANTVVGMDYANPGVNWDAILTQAQGAVSPGQWKQVQATLITMQYRAALVAAGLAQSSNAASTQTK